MELAQVEVYSEESNHAIIRPPGRRFPGAVVQGDSLFILCSEAKRISQRLKDLAITDENLLDIAQDHQEKLLRRLLHYQEILAAYDITLPYGSPVSLSDLVTLLPDDDENTP